MKILDSIDLVEYNPDNIFLKNIVNRGLLYKDGKILLSYNKVLDCYSIPEIGGLKDADAVKFTSDFKSFFEIEDLNNSFCEFGSVILKFQNDSVYETENRLYFYDYLEGSDEFIKDNENFSFAFKDPFMASKHNEYHSNFRKNPIVYSEAKLLESVDLLISAYIRDLKAREKMRNLGDNDYLDMLSFVEDKLSDSEEAFGNKQSMKYSRFLHTKRVLGWTKKLYDISPDKDKLDYDALIIAAIFHDVGKKISMLNHTDHAQEGIPITRDYLLKHGFSTERTEYICSLVGDHSKKYLMEGLSDDFSKIDRNLLLLMEADLMDDSGALGILLDAMITKTLNAKAAYEDCYEHIIRYTKRIQRENPMVTSEAKKIWDDKRKLVNDFVLSLERDLDID